MNKSFLKKIFFIFILCLTFLNGCSKKHNTISSEYPSKIVTLSPSATEILFAIGAENQIAAVSEFSDFPQQAKQMPVVGGFDGKTISMETILSYKPDLVYLTDGMHNYMIAQLNQYGIKYYLSKADSILTIEQEILDMGKITGHQEKAEKVVKEIKYTIASIRKKEELAKVYYEIWNSPFGTAGSNSYINDIIENANGTNIFIDIKEAYPIISEESIIAKNPDVILIPISNGISVEDVKKRKGWQNINAVKNNKIYLIDDNLYSRPGPRVKDAVISLNKLLKNE